MGNIKEEYMGLAKEFELLSIGFLLPTRTTEEALSSGELQQACTEAPGVAPSLKKAYFGADVEETLRELRSEFTRLFVGEREPLITPYAGVKVSQDKGQKGILFLGAESLAIESFMKRCGMVKNLQDGQANDPMDHMGTMCEFLEYLCLLKAEAIVGPAGIEVDEDDLGEFFETHFELYAVWCASRVKEEARAAFYRSMSDLLEFAIKKTRAILR